MPSKNYPDFMNELNQGVIYNSLAKPNILGVTTKIKFIEIYFIVKELRHFNFNPVPVCVYTIMTLVTI